MKLPTIRGMIDRRILVNYRVDPEALSRVCPQPFRPQIVNGFGVAGICLIRLTNVRPAFLPAWLGIGSENAAHRIAVEWDSDQGVKTGVYIPRRDTSSWLNSIAGGRIFPGVHHRAKFDVQETADRYRVEMTSDDGLAHTTVSGETCENLPADSIFPTVAQCSEFFQSGSLGYSPSHAPGQYDGLELDTFQWQVKPLDVKNVASSFFDDKKVFPSGSSTFDNALLMAGIDHQWHERESICCDSVGDQLCRFLGLQSPSLSLNQLLRLPLPI